jgi:hypothetical protein
VFWNTAGSVTLQTQAGSEKMLTNHAFVDWQRSGNDGHSQVTDPLFVDPSQDDYRLTSTSPAVKLGFVPIDVPRVGIRPEWRAKR